IQRSSIRTLTSQQGKSPMDYVKQGVDQLNQAAEKVKDVVSNATSTVVDAVSGRDNKTSNSNQSGTYDSSRRASQTSNTS
ncbi:unnamed protein product, partial [Rotaria sordida]